MIVLVTQRQGGGGYRFALDLGDRYVLVVESFSYFVVRATSWGTKQITQANAPPYSLTYEHNKNEDHYDAHDKELAVGCGAVPDT